MLTNNDTNFFEIDHGHFSFFVLNDETEEPFWIEQKRKDE